MGISDLIEIIDILRISYGNFKIGLIPQKIFSWCFTSKATKMLSKKSIRRRCIKYDLLISS